MSLKFGTSGLRGLSVDLKGEATALYVTAFAQTLLESGRARPGDPVFVGRDFRDSSPEIAATSFGALARAGFSPVDCGTVPTPALALYAMSRKAAAIMITGSHIPADRNGIKFYRPDGEIDKQDEAAISARAAALESDSAALDATPGTGEDAAIAVMELFCTRNHVILPDNALSGMRIGVYQHSTVARDLFVEILGHYGAGVVPLGRSETFIPVDTEAVSTQTIALLKGWATEHGLDAIVSADGDGDRPLVADETGEPLRGDLLGLIAAKFLKARVVVTPVTSNSGLEKAGGFAVRRTKVGSPFVIAGMYEALAAGETGVMGFEANGGLLTACEFAVHGGTLAALPTRDSLLPVLAVLSQAAEARKPLSEVAAAYRLHVADADRLEHFPAEKSAALMAYLRKSPANLAAFLKTIGAVSQTSDIDGLRITLTDGRIIHLRPSGNAPEMRCYVEAQTPEAAKAVLKQGLDLIRNWGGGAV